MTNDEIKELLRELKKTSEQEDAVKSRKVRITFGPEEEEREESMDEGASGREAPARRRRAARPAGEGLLDRLIAAIRSLFSGGGPVRRQEAPDASDVIYEDDVDFMEKLEGERAETARHPGRLISKVRDGISGGTSARKRKAADIAAEEFPDLPEAPEPDETLQEQAEAEAAGETPERGARVKAAAGKLRGGIGSLFAGKGKGKARPAAEEPFDADLPAAEMQDGAPVPEEPYGADLPAGEPAGEPAGAAPVQPAPAAEAEEESGAGEEPGTLRPEAREIADDTAEESAEESAEEFAEASGEEDIPAGTEDEPAGGKKKRPAKPKRAARPGKLRMWLTDRIEDISLGGIGKKEIIMVASGIVLICLIVFLVTRLLSAPGGSSENVTADEGLSVVVTEEPAQWCTSGTVKMTVKASGKIQTITVNGTDYPAQGGRKAKLEVAADSSELAVMVVTDKEVLSAQVEVPMIDTTAPTVTVSVSEGQAVLNAADDRSGVAHVYVGSAEGMSEIPAYEEYTGPFPVDEGTIYYYYAEDIAGNRSVPAMSAMEAAQSLVLSETGLSLFPGDSARLELTTQPAMGFANDLQWSNSDENVVRLDADGTVTALEKGTAVLQASAAGLAPVSCTVTVTDRMEVTVSAVGDCTLGTDATFGTQGSFDAYYASFGPGYFLQNVKDIFTADDVTFANFEGTLTTLETRADKLYAFKGDAEYAKVLTEGGVEAVTLANNHSKDYGEQSLYDTQAALDAEGIAWCIGPDTAVVNAGGVRVGLVGIYLLDTNGEEKEEQLRQAIEDVRSKGAKLVVVAFHWGSELADSPDSVQTSFGHLAIDLGADLVVGHHPHVLEGIEQYKGRTIAYSLANFCFGGNSNPSDKDTIILQQAFAVTPEGAEPGALTVIPCSVSSDAYSNNYQPTPATGGEAQRIMEKLNARSAQFGQTY